MQLLLVTQEEVAAGKASGALGAGERLLLGVGSLVALEVLQAGKGPLACTTDMGAGLVGLGGREVGAGSGLGRAHGYGGRCGADCQLRSKELGRNGQKDEIKESELLEGQKTNQCLIPVSSAAPAVVVVVVLAVGGVSGLPDEPLGELDELGIVGVFSTLTPLSFIVMMGKRCGRGGLASVGGRRGGRRAREREWEVVGVVGRWQAQANAGEEGSRTGGIARVQGSREDKREAECSVAATGMLLEGGAGN